MTTNPMFNANPAFLDGTVKKLFIDGCWVEAKAGGTFDTTNPATGEILARVSEGGAQDIDLAVAAARRAFEGPWRNFKPDQRQNLILALAELVSKHYEELCILDTLDMGMPIGRSIQNRERVVGSIRYYAAQAMSIHGETIENSLDGEFFTCALKEPIGVVGAIIPWNSPLFATVKKISVALAAGCTLVLKPAEEAPLTPLRIGELCLEAGIPPGVVNIVSGFGETAGARLAAHPDVDKIAFTGSHFTGQKIIRASAGSVKSLSMELGGKSPNIIFADANLDKAVPGAAMATFNNAGQICCAGTRMFVERSIYDEFVARVAEFGSRMRVGNGLDINTQMGPLVSAEQLARVTEYLTIGAQEGAEAVTGGQRLTEGAYGKGNFVAPTVFRNVTDNMRIAREEIFGPVISAIPFDTIDDVVSRANDTIFGLGGGVWTTDVGKAHKVARRIRSGTVWVNAYNVMDPSVPFGGYKMSGYGREGGIHHVDEYLQTKALILNTD
ncbi:aldehyde dehydrogenase family protein [Paraburkholderia solisilvae]|uniref:Betaine aldehyde dehydrogenase n=1 Tax=Paraburkholderia solisilvae TaxID=624376 RepID=A0A6J5DCW4_9BURK|nr:aldehyde dehydrogenase family protein [Paraburkholderia solisilvae]CAB3752068.1 Betaine aldehyde dehydrogenase [Paraburkholderia solisilvae]